MWRTYGNMSPGECMREGKESKIITKDACNVEVGHGSSSKGIIRRFPTSIGPRRLINGMII